MKNCKNCIHSAICDELEEFRDPLWFINTEEEFVCSYYTSENVVPRAKVERLQSILLQFTDIVHKWGAKNNFDTTEISLVPILEKEADSIINKAKQEVAGEIFEILEEIFKKYEQLYKNEICELLFEDIGAEIYSLKEYIKSEIGE